VAERARAPLPPVEAPDRPLLRGFEGRQAPTPSEDCRGLLGSSSLVRRASRPASAFESSSGPWTRGTPGGGGSGRPRGSGWWRPVTSAPTQGIRFRFLARRVTHSPRTPFTVGTGGRIPSLVGDGEHYNGIADTSDGSVAAAAAMPFSARKSCPISHVSEDRSPLFRAVRNRTPNSSEPARQGVRRLQFEIGRPLPAAGPRRPGLDREMGSLTPSGREPTQSLWSGRCRRVLPDRLPNCIGMLKDRTGQGITSRLRISRTAEARSRASASQRGVGRGDGAGRGPTRSERTPL
jgi:hypothetical protein